MTQFACVSMELSTVPLSDAAGIKQVDLFVSIHCDEVWQRLQQGRLKYGLKGGTITLKLENATLVEDESRLETGELSSESMLNFQAIEDDKNGTNQWILTPKTAHSILQGSLENFKLGTLQIHEFPYQVKAVFNIIPADFQITDAEGVWPHDISPNKLAVLERKLAILFTNEIFKTSINTVNLFGESFQKIVLAETPQELSINFENLIQPISQILEAKTNQLLELAQLVDLNPLKDFAGAKFLGANLAGIDLSGANLERANLRGADLSDADLSETELNKANLAGADLSGALLSDANLTQADLHRASLALANLSGANLTQANLTAANLSNANLSEANLTQANLQEADLNHAGLLLTNLTEANLTEANIEATRFRKNAGLSEQMQLNLKQRGAIFEDA